MTEKGIFREILKCWYSCKLWFKKEVWDLMGRTLANTVICMSIHSSWIAGPPVLEIYWPMETSFVIIISLLSQFLKHFRTIKVKRLSSYSWKGPFHNHYVCINEGDFWKAPKDQGLLPGETRMNRGLELPVPFTGFWGEGRE